MQTLGGSCLHGSSRTGTASWREYQDLPAISGQCGLGGGIHEIAGSAGTCRLLSAHFLVWNRRLRITCYGTSAMLRVTPLRALSVFCMPFAIRLMIDAMARTRMLGCLLSMDDISSRGTEFPRRELRRLPIGVGNLLRPSRGHEQDNRKYQDDIQQQHRDSSHSSTFLHSGRMGKRPSSQ